MRHRWTTLFLFVSVSLSAQSQQRLYLKADRLFDGETLHTGWAVIIENDRIIAVGPIAEVKQPKDAIVYQYGDATLLPGLIEGHSHMFLYPYNITDWDTQVLKESDAYRTIRATLHAKKTLLAGYTTVRDLGSEGAGYADVALRDAINDGLIPGPRMLVAGRAIVTTGSYGPKGYDTDQQLMLGAEAADGTQLIRTTRDQIGKGADFIKVYADAAWGPNKEDKPTFTLEELKLIHDVAQSSGRPMVAHAKSKEGMKRAILGGVETIEHGDQLDEEIISLMKEHHVTYYPTLTAAEMILEYRGWKKGSSPEPLSISHKKKSFTAALNAGVRIGMGGDVGVFPHGDNSLELEKMVAYGMKPLDVLKAATSVNAVTFHIDNQVGFLRPGMKADIIIVGGDPSTIISSIRTILFVMKDGVVYKSEPASK